MQLFLADCQFPDIENQVKAYQLFVEAWENGEIASSDKTDKFEMYLECMLLVKVGLFVYVRHLVIKKFLSILLHGEPNLAFIWNLHL